MGHTCFIHSPYAPLLQLISFIMAKCWCRDSFNAYLTMKHFLFVLLNVTHTVDYVTGGPIKLNGSSSIKRSVHLLLDAFLQQKQSICVHFDEFQSLTLR